MIILAAFAVVVLTVPLAGGSLTHLARLRLRWPILILSAMGLQVLIVNVLEHQLSGATAEAIHLASYALALAFVWINRKVVGLPILAAGAIMNAMAIAANGGVMPATEWALRTAGEQPEADGRFTNSGRVDDAKLVFLGDCLAIPEGLPLANVFSIGDVLLVAGGGVILHSASRSRWSRAGRRGDDPTGPITTELEVGVEASRALALWAHVLREAATLMVTQASQDRLEMRTRDGSSPLVISASFVPDGDARTVIRLEHDGWEALGDDAVEARAEAAGVWETMAAAGHDATLQLLRTG